MNNYPKIVNTSYMAIESLLSFVSDTITPSMAYADLFENQIFVKGGSNER